MTQEACIGAFGPDMLFQGLAAKYMPMKTPNFFLRAQRAGTFDVAAVEPPPQLRRDQGSPPQAEIFDMSAPTQKDFYWKIVSGLACSRRKIEVSAPNRRIFRLERPECFCGKNTAGKG